MLHSQRRPRAHLVAALTLFTPLSAVVLGAVRSGAQVPDTAVVPPMVITATRTAMSALASPATIDVISGDDLRRRGVTSVATALQSLPGVTLAQSGSFGAVTSLFLRGGESKYAKVLIDGVAVNDPGGSMDFSTLTTDNIERIEVLRGPASVLYGADAVAGVIQIITRRGSGIPRAVVSARGGSYGSRDADASMVGAAGAGDFSLGVARHDTRGIYAFNNAFRNTVASGAVRVVLDARSDLRVAIRYGDDVFHYPTDGGGAVVDTNARQSLERTTLSAELGRAFTERLDAHLSLMSSGTSGGTDNPKDTPAGSAFQSIDHTRRRALDLRANVGVATGTTVTLGAQAEQEDQQTQSESVFGAYAPSISIFHASRRNRAGYLQVLSMLPGGVVLTSGGRLDDNERFGRFGTYRVGASWRALDGMHMRASLGSAYREPTFFENYATGYVTGNPALAPERARTWEIGVRQNLIGDRLTVGVTQFEQQFRNMIDYTGATTACGASYCNVAAARASGRELEARLAAVPGVAFDANLTHLDTRVADAGFDVTPAGLYRRDEQLIRRPRTSWNLGAQFSRAGGSLDLRAIHVGVRTDRDFRPYPAVPVVVAAYTRTDFAASLPLRRLLTAARGAELTVRVENLFDVEYQSAFNFLTPRRTILGGVRMTF